VVLTLGFIVVASLVFAALNRSPLALFGFPVLITVWTAYLWVFTAGSIRSFSVLPRSPWRVAFIIVVCCFVALAALAASVLIGLLLGGPRPFAHHRVSVQTTARAAPAPAACSHSSVRSWRNRTPQPSRTAAAARQRQ
jgi:hypothetical protein